MIYGSLTLTSNLWILKLILIPLLILTLIELSLGSWCKFEVESWILLTLLPHETIIRNDTSCLVVGPELIVLLLLLLLVSEEVLILIKIRRSRCWKEVEWCLILLSKWRFTLVSHILILILLLLLMLIMTLLYQSTVVRRKDIRVYTLILLLLLSKESLVLLLRLKIETLELSIVTIVKVHLRLIPLMLHLLLWLLLTQRLVLPVEWLLSLTLTIRIRSH